MENKIALSIELVNGVLNYLATKPFAEVAPLINKIQGEANGQTAPASASAPAEE